MSLAEATRTTTFRWGLAIALALLAQSSILGGLFYWLTVRHATAEVDKELAADCRTIEGLPRAAIVDTIRARVAADVHRVRLSGLFDAAGTRLAGNIAKLPPVLAAHEGPLVVGLVRSDPPDPVPNSSRSIACSTKDGGRVVFARDMDELDDIAALIRRALIAVALPAAVLAAILGLVLSLRAQKRFSLVEGAIALVIAGDLERRLPVRRSAEPFDRLSASVNVMLDRLQKAIDEVRGLGDDIAHELRTPLTRLRARLERGCQDAATRSDFREVGDRALHEIDHALSIVSAILRIRAIEEAKRGSEFTAIDVRALLRDAADLYRPSADLRHITIAIEEGPPARLRADRDLMMEAICNLIDNAIKFSPEHGEVRCGVTGNDGHAIGIVVADSGPGIPPEEHSAVFRRFHRGRSRMQTDGHGIGLSLVAAIAELHGYTIAVADCKPGCEIRINCGPHPPS